jgi:gliding motility-associated-like protein
MENKKNKNLIKNILLLISLFFLIPEDTTATHIVGGNITYSHVSGDIYQVKLVLRRDCFLGSPEAQFDDPASIGIFTGSGALAVWLANNGQIRIPFMASDTLNEFIQSDCGFEGTQVCVHETTYQGNVFLPQRPGGYILSYQRCCRNASLNNVMDPLETGSTYWVEVTEQSLTLKNSTPTFDQWPDVYICANRPLAFDHKATDEDRDSLVYKLCVPSLGATRANPKPQPPGFPSYNNVIWAPPYSLNDMMGGVPLKIDSKTGEITANPNLVGQFLIGVCVEEYRNGVLLSTVRRDFQYNVRVCSQSPLAQFTTSESNCDGLTVEFYNNSLSSSAYQWDFDYPSTDPAFQSTEANPIFTFPQSGIYNVRLRATRGTDGCFDTILQTVAVFDNKIVPDFTYALSGCNEGQDSLTLLLRDLSVFDQPGYSLNSWNWKVTQKNIVRDYTGSSPNINISNTGNVDIQLEVFADNGCRSVVSKQIPIEDIVPELDFKIEYTGCPENDSVDIRLINLSGPLNLYATIDKTAWNISGTEYQGDSVVVKVPLDPQSINITLLTNFYALCEVELSKSILLAGHPTASFTATGADCTGLTIGFINNSLNTSAFEWNFNYPDTAAIFKSTEANPTFTFPQAGQYTVWLKSVRGSDGCFDTLVQTIDVFENKIVPDFTYSLIGCEEGKDSLKVLLKDVSAFNELGFGLNRWGWIVVQNGKEVLYSGSSPEIVLSNAGVAEVTLNVFADNGCQAQIVKQITVSDLIPEVDFDYVLNGCPSDSTAEIKIINLSGALNPFATIESSQWTINNQVLSGDSIIVNLPQKTKDFSVKLLTTFYKDCNAELIKTFDLSQKVPYTAYGYEPVECPDDETVKIRLFYVDSIANDIQVSGIAWGAGTIGNQNPYNGTNIELIIPKDSVLLFNMTTTFTNGCTDKLSNSFLPGPFAAVEFIEDPVLLCQGEVKPLLSNGNPDWTYTWSPSVGLDLTDPSNPKVVSDSNRTYVVTVSDGLCAVTDSVRVIVLQGGVILSINADTVTCDGNVVLTATGGVGPGTYSWGNDPAISEVIGIGQTISTSFVGREKLFYVKFIGETCSTMPAEIKITNQAPSIEDLSPITLCREDTVRLTTLNLISTHINTFNWDADEHIVSGAETANPTIRIGSNENQPFYLNYEVTNQFGCLLKDSILFNITENPKIDFDFNLTACGDYQICFSTTGNFQGFAKWDFGDLSSNDDVSISNAPCYTYPDGGTYNVVLTNLVNICPFKDVVKSVTVNPQIRLDDIPDSVLCAEDTIQLKATSNLENIKYTWSDIAGVILTTGADFSGVFDQDTKLILKGTDIYGCTDTDTVSVNYFKFQYTFDVKDSVCVNEPTALKLNLANPEFYEIQWSPAGLIVSGGTTTSPVIKSTADTTITVKIKHIASGCEETRDVDIMVTSPFAFDITADDVICLDVATGISLIINNPNDYTYLWTPAPFIVSGANTINPQIKITKDQTFTVKVTNKLSGCSQTKDKQVLVGEDISVVIDAEPDLTIFEGESLELFVMDPVSGSVYKWSTGETGISINVSPTETTTYQVTVTDINGCTAVDDVIVTVRTAQCDETDIFIPNAFTPNNDGNNDIFRVRSNFIDEMELIIYNRWGQEVFRTTDKNGGWDGTFNGQELAPDAYAYYLSVLCINAETYKKKGNVSLLR